MPNPEPLRLKIKVWVHPETGMMYAVPMGTLDLRTGQMLAFAMTDDGNVDLKLSADDWNQLEYRYFKDDGPAPKPEKKTTIPRI